MKMVDSDRIVRYYNIREANSCVFKGLSGGWFVVEDSKVDKE